MRPEMAYGILIHKIEDLCGPRQAFLQQCELDADTPLYPTF
jgi:hypothetical protein